MNSTSLWKLDQPKSMNLENLDIPHLVNWIAQDADGQWWGYQVEPLQNHHGWYENEVGQNIRLHRDKASKDWENTLRKIS